jgi:RNA polymerase subunit RPABC4/transcription elongation factor Spt4
LLVIFIIPLILKVFEFLQVGAIFQFFFNIISFFFGGLIFLISYAYILLIPLVGFGMIKFFQTVVFNPKIQAVNRIQKSQCIRCAKKIRPQDSHCPHCGYYQYVECHNCHNLTYKELPYCHHCGADQNHATLGQN